METTVDTENVVGADTLLKFFNLGKVDRECGLPIQTHNQHVDGTPGMSAEDQDDTYRAYRAGYIAK